MIDFMARDVEHFFSVATTQESPPRLKRARQEYGRVSVNIMESNITIEDSLYDRVATGAPISL
jgi:hypothetical protein